MYKCFTFILDENEYKQRISWNLKAHTKNFHTAKLPFGELILQRDFRTAKYPCCEISYDEMSLRRNFHTAKLLSGEVSFRRNFLRRNSPRRNFLRRKFRSRSRRLEWTGLSRSEFRWLQYKPLARKLRSP